MNEETMATPFATVELTCSQGHTETVRIHHPGAGHYVMGSAADQCSNCDEWRTGEQNMALTRAVVDALERELKEARKALHSTRNRLVTVSSQERHGATVEMADAVLKRLRAQGVR